METWLYFGLRLVHILAMAVWIGATVIAPYGFRRTLALGPEHTLPAVDRLLAATTLIIVAGFTTFLSGAALIYVMGGVSVMPTRILVGAGLTLGIYLIGGTISRPAMTKMRAHFAGGGDVAGAMPFIRTFEISINVEMALRLAVLVLMVVKVF